MSSYEDRMRAVALYIKLGKRAKATIRQLGYPSKNALKGWCREYEHRSQFIAGWRSMLVRIFLHSRDYKTLASRISLQNIYFL
ncbi:hypothetical protein [Brucella pituitosa]|uniref:hypothetical protein n=1 Tax=Brucella pituitosa TaxID=571256 RepID=UPI000CFE5403|nr:hypothetical protein CQ062_20180 [Ochrobactrum sp. MYb68]